MRKGAAAKGADYVHKDYDDYHVRVTDIWYTMMGGVEDEIRFVDRETLRKGALPRTRFEAMFRKPNAKTRRMMEADW